MEDGYIIITPAMIENLGLKGTELLCFAVIHGYSRDRQGVFTGSIAYVSAMLGVAPRTIVYAMKALCEKGLLEKTSLKIANVERVEYQTSKEAMQKLHRGVCKNCIDLCKNCTPLPPDSPSSSSPTPLSTIPPITPQHQVNNTPSTDVECVYAHTPAREKIGDMMIVEDKRAYGEKVLLSTDEFRKLLEKFGAEDAARLVEILDDYLVNHPRKRYSSHYRAILSWCVPRLQEEKITAQRLKNAREAGERYGKHQTPQGGASALALANEMAQRAAELSDHKGVEE